MADENNNKQQVIDTMSSSGDNYTKTTSFTFATSSSEPESENDVNALLLKLAEEEQPSVIDTKNNKEGQIEVTTEEEDEALSPYTINELEWHGMVRVGEASEDRESVVRAFMRGMGTMAVATEVISVHKNQMEPRSPTMQTWRSVFKAHASGLVQKRQGEAVFAHAWFGAPRDELFGIVKHGFARFGDGAKGLPVRLSSITFALDSALKSEVDEGGVRHVILCRANLGKLEEVKRNEDSNSDQIVPSSEEFDSGVDSISCPTKFTIWNPFLNARIFPHYIVSFTTDGLDDLREARLMFKTPQCNAFAILLVILNRFLEPDRMDLILRFHNHFKAGKISRPQMIKSLREIAGDLTLKRAVTMNPLNPANHRN